MRSLPPLLPLSIIVTLCAGIIANFYSPRFCSRECRYERNKGNHVLPRPDIGIITCRECGKTGSSTEFFSAKYCSKKCRYERGGRPPAHFRSDPGASVDSAISSDSRLKSDVRSSKFDAATSRPSSLPHPDSNACLPLAAGMPLLATAHASILRPSLTYTPAFDASTHQMTSTVAANWQMLADYQPRDKEQAMPYLLDSIAAIQDSIVHVSLQCEQQESLLAATSRRLLQLENDINACVAGAADAESADDRKVYHDVVRKLWMDKGLHQKDEVRMLEQLRHMLESRNKLRSQLLDKQQALLTLGLTVRHPLPSLIFCNILRLNVRASLAWRDAWPAAVAALLPLPRGWMRHHLHRFHRGAKVAS
jgi:hypothetical protein